jgi:DNA-directed RNA polymerase subunit RPC12/RpoP
MNRQAFIQAKRRYNYGVVLPGMILLTVMVILPFAWYGIQDKHRELLMIERIAGNAICVAFCIFGLWFIYVYGERVYRRLRYWCPHCEEGFGGYENEVLETGKCHYCGFQVIDITEQPHPPEPAAGPVTNGESSPPAR